MPPERLGEGELHNVRARSLEGLGKSLLWSLGCSGGSPRGAATHAGALRQSRPLVGATWRSRKLATPEVAADQFAVSETLNELDGVGYTTAADDIETVSGR